MQISLNTAQVLAFKPTPLYFAKTMQTTLDATTKAMQSLFHES